MRFLVTATAVAFLALTTCELAFANQCKCPSRDFLAQRVINVDGVQDIIYGVMNQKYFTTLDYFTKSLATDADVTVNPDDDVLVRLDDLFCFHGTVTHMRFELPSGLDVTVKLQLRSLALVDGVSVEICKCRLAGGQHGNGPCPAELIDYLQANAEDRMEEIKQKLTG